MWCKSTIFGCFSTDQQIYKLKKSVPEILCKSSSARVVNVSSNLHHVGILGSISADATREHSWYESPLQMYSNSKLALNMASKELAKLFQRELFFEMETLAHQNLGHRNLDRGDDITPSVHI